MKDKQYFINLANRYFEAETSLAEERELRDFIATCSDPDFDEIKVVMGFMSMESKAYGFAPRKRASLLRYAVAAVAIALLIMVPFLKIGSSDCMMIAEGETTTNQEVVMDELGKEMAMLFSTDESNSIESDMALVFN